MCFSKANRTWAVLALIAVGVYCLCCKPAWRPDGKEVAYIASSAEEEALGVAVYNVETETSRCVMTANDPDGPQPFEVFWTAKNELLVVEGPFDDSSESVIRLQKVNPKNGKTSKLASVPAPGGFEGGIFAVLEAGRWAWVPFAENRSLRIDTETGKHETIDALPVARDGGMAYMREAANGGVEFGRVESKPEPELHKWCTISAAEGEDLLPFGAVPRDKVRIACVAGESGKAKVCVYDEQGGQVKEFALPEEVAWDSGDKGLASQQAAWSPDGSRLWLALQLEKEDGERAGVAEMSMDGGLRLIPLPADVEGILGLALSPDGRYLAATLFDEGPVGLCLIRLEGGERPVKVIQGLPPMKEAGGSND